MWLCDLTGSCQMYEWSYYRGTGGAQSGPARPGLGGPLASIVGLLCKLRCDLLIFLQVHSENLSSLKYH